MLAYARYHGLSRPPEGNLQRLLDTICILPVNDKDLNQPFQDCDNILGDRLLREPLQISRDASQLLAEVSQCAIDRETQWLHLSPRFKSDLDFPLENRRRAAQINCSIPRSLFQALTGLQEVDTFEDSDIVLCLQGDVVESCAAWTHEKLLLSNEALDLLRLISSPGESKLVARLEKTSRYESYYLDPPLRRLDWHDVAKGSLSDYLSDRSFIAEIPDLCGEEAQQLQKETLEDETHYVEKLLKDVERESKVVQLSPRIVLELDCPLTPRPAYSRSLPDDAQRPIANQDLEHLIDLDSSSSTVNLAEVFNLDRYEMLQERLELSHETLYLKEPQLPSRNNPDMGRFPMTIADLTRSVHHSRRHFVVEKVSTRHVSERVAWTPFPGIGNPFDFAENLVGEAFVQDYVGTDIKATVPYVGLSSPGSSTSLEAPVGQGANPKELLDENFSSTEVPVIDIFSSMPTTPSAAMDVTQADATTMQNEVRNYSDILQESPREVVCSDDSFYILLKRKRETMEQNEEEAKLHRSKDKRQDRFEVGNFSDAYFRLQSNQLPSTGQSRPAAAQLPVTRITEMEEQAEHLETEEVDRPICPVLIPTAETIVTTWIISTTLLQRVRLTRALRSQFPSVRFLERALDPVSEVDLVTSPSSGIIVTADTEALDKLVARLDHLRHKYARVDIVMRLGSGGITPAVSTFLARLAPRLLRDVPRTGITLVRTDEEEIAYLASLAQNVPYPCVSTEADHLDDEVADQREAFLSACPLLNPAAVRVLLRSGAPLGGVGPTLKTYGLDHAAVAALDAYFATRDWRS